MGLTRSQRIMILLVIDTNFFFLEIIVGYAVHSLALVADSFHMLNDVFSLLVALWAIRLAKAKSTNDYTYGWQRAEVLGALVNGVFLLALCLSIFLEAIQRFFEPQEIQNPWLVLGVGSAGLASNIIGLFLFHEHGHSHGGHDHAHSHDIESEPHSHDTQPIGIRQEEDEDEAMRRDRGDIEHILPGSYVKRMAARSVSPRPRADSSYSSKARRSTDTVTRQHQRFASPVTDIHVHPAMNRQEVLNAAVSEHSESVVSDTDDERTPLVDSTTRGRPRADSAAIHSNHNHNKPKRNKGGHSHGNLNMHGVFLHVLGDALGNVGVILTALFVKFAPNYKLTAPFTHYADPLISLIITIIIFSSALPLVKSASKILLQGVPKGISLEEVKEDLRGIPGIEDIHELHIWQLSDVKMIASLHIQISFDPEQGNERKYMKLAKNVRTCLHAFGVHSVTIQPEYIAPGEVAAIRAAAAGDDGYGAVRVRASGRTSPSCLMECGDGCAAGKCCEPAPEPTDHGHDHGHAH